MALLGRDVVPSTAVTPSNRGPIVEVAAAFCTSVALVFFCTRVLIRWPWYSLMGRDDLVTGLASIMSVVQMVLAFCAVWAGLGKKSELLSHSQKVKADKFIYSSDLIYVLTMYLSRFAVVLFFFRLEKSKRTSTYVKALAAVCLVLCPISIIIVATQQYHVSSWILPSSSVAGGRLARWVIVEVIGDLFDVAIALYPVYLVRGVQMKRKMKVRVIVGVAIRFPIIPISIVRLAYLARSLYSPEYFFTYVDTEILTQVEMSFALISSTVPTLQLFLRAAKSSLLGETVHGTQAGSHASHSANKSRRTTRLRSKTDADEESIELADRIGGTTTTTITKGSNKSSIASDSSELGIVMHHTVDIQLDSLESLPTRVHSVYE